MTNMISFIIIGQNESWKLTKCFESIFETISYNKLKKYEVIYIDSKSSDDSIERALKFSEVKIFKLTGDCNAAIARNIGAKESIGNTLFFIDGDMELNETFLKLIFSEERGLVDNFISGNWINYFYNNAGVKIGEKFQKKMTGDKTEYVTGGLFLIRKRVWENVGGMNPIFKKSQDIDLGLRLASMGVYLLRKKEIAATHHTIEYLHKERMWKDFLSLNQLYSKSLLYRKLMFNRFIYSRLLRNDYSLLLLIFSFLILFYLNSWIPFYVYLILLIFRAKLSFNRFLYFVVRDLATILGGIFFYPSNKFNIKYNKISY